MTKCMAGAQSGKCWVSVMSNISTAQPGLHTDISGGEKTTVLALSQLWAFCTDHW